MRYGTNNDDLPPPLPLMAIGAGFGFGFWCSFWFMSFIAYMVISIVRMFGGFRIP